METGIRQGFSTASDARAAVQELAAALQQPDIGLVLFFCSSDYDLELLASEINRSFAGMQVVGCTTAGQIGANGYRERGLVGVSFSASASTAVVGFCENLEQFTPADGHALADRLRFALGDQAPQANAGNTFGLLLIDGLSLREEMVARTVKETLGPIPIFGGSAGDGLNFRRTHVFAYGRFRSGAAALVLASTPLPFTVFKTEHLVPTRERWVITKASPGKRIAREINGLPAAEEFARLAGVEVSALTPQHLAANPLTITISGHTYVRTAWKVNPDRSVTFFCAIEEGVVLRVARGAHLVENLIDALARLQAHIGPPQLVLACDCVFRRMEIVDRHQERRVEKVFQFWKTVGFNTYGEVYEGVHVNQTLTGIAFGALPAEVVRA
jgi:hypothetical protein